MSWFTPELLDKYPSLRKIEEMQYDYVESHDGREMRVLEYLKSRPDFASLHNNPPAILAAIDEYSNQHEFMISIGPDKTGVVRKLLSQEKPRVVVELGGYVGYSAVFFAHELRRIAAGSNDSSSADGSTPQRIHVWSLEFEPEFAKIIEEIVALAGLRDYVTVVVGPADRSLRELKAAGKVDSVDLLFLDHVETLYEQDFKVAEELGLLKSGACVLADNVVVPGAPEYRAYVRAHKGLASRGVKGLIMPGEKEDEFEFSKVL